MPPPAIAGTKGSRGTKGSKGTREPYYIKSRLKLYSFHFSLDT